MPGRSERFGTRGDGLRERVLEALAADRFDAVFARLEIQRRPSASGWVNGRCPFHEDRSPSFGYSVRTGRWKCQAGCGAGDAFDFVARVEGLAGFGETLRTLADRLGIAHSRGRHGVSRGAPRGGLPCERLPGGLARRRTRMDRRLARPARSALPSTIPPSASSRSSRTNDGERAFTPEDARRVWEAACAAMDTDGADARAREDLLEYLEARGLCPAKARSLFGLVSRDVIALHPSLVRWIEGSYQLIAPLFDIETGELVSVQARRIVRDGEGPKTLFPRGARASGTVFADKRGVAVLRGDASEEGTTDLVLGEGLTDFLALAMAAAAPVLALPGVSMARSSIGAWARGRRIYLVLDNDAAGDRVEWQTSRAIRRAGGSAAYVRWPGHAKDACEVLEGVGWDGFQNLVRRMAS